MACLNDQACGVLDLASAARCPHRVFLSKHSKQDEEPDLGQESYAHDLESSRKCPRLQLFTASNSR